jgi:hypothetical protein
MHSERRTSLPGPWASALTVVSLSLLAAACGGSESPSQSAQQSTAPPAASAPAGGGGRVFFIEPKEGATVKSPVKFEFGSDEVTIAAVPATVETPRPGMGHHHLGVDTDCLPVGEVIPKASPWIHFGDGKTVIEMQLSPGPHKFALQLGDDQHRTMQGLCQVINVTVAE